MGQDDQGNTKFGTFGGVFTPCTLTILGVIMFLRFGQVVGQAGIIYALLIVAASKLITTLTTLSLSAIATNTRVQGGGAYYLISRSLGVEFGGAIGVVFYLAQAISVAMYIIGFTEAFLGTFGIDEVHFISIATIVNIGTFICVYVGASWAIKVQYFILAALLASLLSFFAGAIPSIDLSLMRTNLSPNFEEN
ncbi:MAG: amino acid permease, partial [Planctomycetaceae bacterium]|nr:amino acid permease [Planctomycetaceae bacterium]